jgi:hypothetical protein
MTLSITIGMMSAGRHTTAQTRLSRVKIGKERAMETADMISMTINAAAIINRFHSAFFNCSI